MSLRCWSNQDPNSISYSQLDKRTEHCCLRDPSWVDMLSCRRPHRNYRLVDINILHLIYSFVLHRTARPEVLYVVATRMAIGSNAIALSEPGCWDASASLHGSNFLECFGTSAISGDISPVRRPVDLGTCVMGALNTVIPARKKASGSRHVCHGRSKRRDYRLYLLGLGRFRTSRRAG